MGKLNEYRRKREFSRTQEPAGRDNTSSSEDALRFVIQKHQASHLHFDLRLEMDGVLKSWAVPKGPSIRAGERRLAVEVEDHPIEYGQFEGTIPKGEYGGGTVMLWDHGRWSPTPKGRVEDGRIDFLLDGQKLQGAWSLIRTKSDPAKSRGKPNWLLIKRSDNGCKTSNLDDFSVLTGRTMDEITAGAPASSSESIASTVANQLAQMSAAKKAKLAAQVTPALATLDTTVPKGTDWIHEIKLDGYRLLSRITPGSTSRSKSVKNAANKVQLLTRNGNDWTGKLSTLHQRLQALPCKSALLDGELVAYEPGGKTSFYKLQQAFSAKATAPLIYQIFDITYLNGHDLSKVPLVERKAILQTLLAEQLDSDDRSLRFTEHVVGKGPEFYAQACDLGLEGVISKRAASVYTSGRSRSWLKVKCTGRDEFIVCGYTAPRGSRTGFGALLLAAWHNQRLIYTGKVGTGFNQRSLDSLAAQLKRLEVTKSPLDTGSERSKHKTEQFTAAELDNITWVRPQLIAAVEFTNWTREGRLRHPVYRGLREDIELDAVLLPPEHPLHQSAETSQASSKTPAAAPSKTAGVKPSLKKVTVSEVKSQRLKIEGVALSNPQRVLYPTQGLTKADLATYYAELAEWVLPYVKNRPLALVRCPAGVSDECFFQKHPGNSLHRSVPRVNLDGKQGLYIEKLADLMHVIQIGALELHSWGSTVENLECPDTLVFDLDPAPDVSILDTYCLALELRDFLSSFGLHSFPRTTGGKGLHLVVPIGAHYEWPQVKQFCRGIAVAFARDNPTKATAQLSKSKRQGRVFIDYLRNGRGATAIVNFSTRARPGAPVAAPIRWDEVSASLRPNQYTVSNLKRRLSQLRADPWGDYATLRQSISAHALKAMEKIK